MNSKKTNKLPIQLAIMLGVVFTVALVFLVTGHDATALGLLAVAPIMPNPELEFANAVNEIKTGVTEMTTKLGPIESNISRLEKDHDRLSLDVTKMKKQMLGRSLPQARKPGSVSEECARALGSYAVLMLGAKGYYDGLDSHARERAFGLSRECLGLQTRTAISTSDIALPTEYGAELLELVAEYGVARQVMTRYPIMHGTAKPARLGTQNDFGFISMSAAIPEKNVGITFASLESHKVGGIVRMPREIDEQSIVPIGAMLARYGARKFAKMEDTVGFLGDGTAGATYDSIKGVCQIAADNSKVVTLGATKTAPSDAVLSDLRSLRSLVASPVIGSGFYFLHVTWEARLRQFKTQADPVIYVQEGPMGKPTLDGYPIIWTEVMAPYSTTASASTYLAVFGDLSYWWLGEHGQPRIDTDVSAYFTTDELAVRFIEEIDFDYAAVDCAAALKTAAA